MGHGSWTYKVLYNGNEFKREQNLIISEQIILHSSISFSCRRPDSRYKVFLAPPIFSTFTDLSVLLSPGRHAPLLDVFPSRDLLPAPGSPDGLQRRHRPLDGGGRGEGRAGDGPRRLLPSPPPRRHDPRRPLALPGQDGQRGAAQGRQEQNRLRGRIGGELGETVCHALFF